MINVVKLQATYSSQKHEIEIIKTIGEIETFVSHKCSLVAIG